MTIETIRTPSGFKNLDLDVDGAALITATSTKDGPATVSFPAGSVPGDTESVGFFAIVAGNTDIPVCLVQPVDVTQFTFTSAVLSGTLTYADFTLYGFDITLTRVLAGGASSTTTAVPYITVQGKTIVLDPFDVECPA